MSDDDDRTTEDINNYLCKKADDDRNAERSTVRREVLDKYPLDPNCPTRFKLPATIYYIREHSTRNREGSSDPVHTNSKHVQKDKED